MLMSLQIRIPNCSVAQDPAASVDEGLVSGSADCQSSEWPTSGAGPLRSMSASSLPSGSAFSSGPRIFILGYVH